MKWIYQLHRVTGLIVAPFLLLLCLTGFFLLFGEEIYDWNAAPSGGYDVVSEEVLYRHLPEALKKAETEAPGQAVQSIRFMPSIGSIRMRLQEGDSPDARRMIELHLKNSVLQESLPRAYCCAWVGDAMQLMLLLHVRLNDGEAGELFLVIICLLTIVSIGTGFLLYPAFTEGMPFGVRRRSSRRRWWSDWHKALGILTGSWLCVLSLSGIGLYLYEAGSDHYNEAAWTAAGAQFTVPTGATISADHAVERVRRAVASGQSIQSICLPDAEHPFYAFEVAKVSSETNLYTPHQWVFMASDGTGTLLIPNVSADLLWSVLFVNLHFHNHDSLPLKGMWTFFLFLSVLLTVSGVVVYITRFFQGTMSKEEVFPLVRFHHYAVWTLALLPVIGLFLPLWGVSWIAAAAFGCTTVGALCLMNRMWFSRGK